MKELIKCKINGIEVLITDNAVRTKNSSLQIELVKRLIECKELSDGKKSALPLFFNKYLRFYDLSNVEFTSKVATRAFAEKQKRMEQRIAA